MQIQCRHLSSVAAHFLRESVLPSLTPLQKKVMAIAAIVIASFAAIYILRRCLYDLAKDSPVKQEMKEQNVQILKPNNVLLKPIAHELERDEQLSKQVEQGVKLEDLLLKPEDKARTQVEQMHNVIEDAKQALDHNDIHENSVDDLIDRMRPFVKNDPFPPSQEEVLLNKVISSQPEYSKYKEFIYLQATLVDYFKQLYVKKIQFLMSASDANIPEAYAYFSLINGLQQMIDVLQELIDFEGTNDRQGDLAGECLEKSARLIADSDTWETSQYVDVDGTSFANTFQNRTYLKYLYLDNMPLADTAPGKFALGKLHYYMTKHRFTPCASGVLKDLKAVSPQLAQGFTFSQARNYLEECLNDQTLPLADRAQAALYFSKIVHNSGLANPDPDPTKAENQRRTAKMMLKHYLDQVEVPPHTRAQLAYQLGVYYWNHPKEYKKKAFNALLRIYEMDDIDKEMKRAAALQMLKLCYNKYVNVPTDIDYYQLLSQEYDRRKETFITPLYSIQYQENASDRYRLINENDKIITFLMMDYYIHHMDQKPAHVDIAKEIKRCLRMASDGQESSRYYDLLGDHLHLNKAQVEKAIYYYDCAVSLIPRRVFLGRGPYTKEYTEDAVSASKILQKIVKICRDAGSPEKADAYMNHFISSFSGDPLKQMTMFLEIVKNPTYKGLEIVKLAAAKMTKLYKTDPILCSPDDYQLALRQIDTDILEEQSQQRA